MLEVRKMVTTQTIKLGTKEIDVLLDDAHRLYARVHNSDNWIEIK